MRNFSLTYFGNQQKCPRGLQSWVECCLGKGRGLCPCRAIEQPRDEDSAASFSSSVSLKSATSCGCFFIETRAEDGATELYVTSCFTIGHYIPSDPPDGGLWMISTNQWFSQDFHQWKEATFVTIYSNTVCWDETRQWVRSWLYLAFWFHMPYIRMGPFKSTIQQEVRHPRATYFLQSVEPCQGKVLNLFKYECLDWLSIW